MKSSKLMFLAGVGIILIYGVWLFIAPKVISPRNAQSASVSQFARGTWRMEARGADARGTYVETSQVEFVAPGTLVFDQWRVYSDDSRAIYFYNLKMGYRFISDTQLRTAGRSIENWNLSKDGDTLSIDAGDSIVPSGRYVRLDRPDWRIIALGLGMLMIASLSLWPVPMAPNRHKAIEAFKAANQPRFRFVARVMMRGLVLLLLVSGGSLIGRYLSEQWKFFFIRLPWDSIILLEISLTLIIIGIHFGVSLIVDDAPSRWLTRKWAEYPGAVLGGVGLWGALVGLLYLLLFFIAGGTYGFGA